jgi:flagellar hook-associated protein 2
MTAPVSSSSSSAATTATSATAAAAASAAIPNSALGSVGAVQGLASGVQWQTIIDQITAVDSARELTPITTAITANQSSQTAWSTYQTQAQAVSDALTGLQDGSAIQSFAATGGTSPSTGRTLLTATAGTGAAPGSYQVEVDSIAQAEKVSGSAVSSSTTALGYSGNIVINGHEITVGSTDTLSSIRDAINAADTGTTPSGVTATVLSTANGANRLVLTSDAAGSRGIQMIDSASSGGVLQQLGILDGSYSIGVNADGSSTGAPFVSPDVAIGTSLGINPPPATTIQVGNKTISVDLQTDTLNTLVAKLQAAGIGASATSTTTGTVTSYSLQINAGVSAIPSAGNNAVPDPDSLRALELLGFATGGRSSVAQTVGSAPLTDASNAVATTATNLTALQVNGATANIQAGDTIVATGRRGDGTAVSVSLVVGSGTTLNDLLAQLNGSTGFGGGTRPATASIGADGSLDVTDGTAGDSQLALALTVNKSTANGGGTTGLGSFGTQIVGRLREITAGADAQLRVDGVLLTRSSNTVTDAINGVTLNLQQAEVGTTTSVNVTQDTTAAVAAAQLLVTAYNTLQTFVSSETATGADLANNGTIKASAQAFVNAMLATVSGSTLSPTEIGLSLDKAGTMSLDTATFTAALQNNAAGVQQLLSLSGTATGTGLTYIGAGTATPAGPYAVNVTSLATIPTTTSSAATFPYASGSTAHNLTLVDNTTGKSGSIALVNGDDSITLAAKLNTMFAAQGMRMTASAASGNLTISGVSYGASSSFTLSYDSGDTTSAAQLGLAAQKYSGTDIAGTINGVAANGLGQTLTGPTGSVADGLIVRYAGTATGAVGTANVSVGTAEMLARAANAITETGDGLVATMNNSLSESLTSLQQKSADVTERLANSKAALTKQFTAMETAIANIQAQGARISATLSSLGGGTVSTSSGSSGG